MMVLFSYCRKEAVSIEMGFSGQDRRESGSGVAVMPTIRVLPPHTALMMALRAISA